MKRRPPITLILLLLLVAGAIVNITVAWGCCVFADATALPDWKGLGYSAYERGDQPWRGIVSQELRGLGKCQVDTQAFPWGYGGTIFPPVEVTADEVIPDWARGIHQPPTERSPAVAVIRSHIASGWPMLAVIAGVDATIIAGIERAEPLAFTIVVGTSSRPTSIFPDQWRMLGCRPIWPGFAINTVFYAVVMWLLFAGPFVLRRRRRIRRGLCPKCAYDLRGTRGGPGVACPECGAAIPCLASNHTG